MRPMLIGWRLEPFRCEFRGESTGGWLHVFNDDELVGREPVSSLLVAYQRARELVAQLLWKRAKGA